MNYSVKNKEIVIEIDASNDGKFRFKTRDSNLQFGEIFSTRKNNFNENAYLEWQIGYDAVVSDVKNGNKETRLKNQTFIGANGKEKYLYELSELVYEGMKNNLISVKSICDLLEEIEEYEDFIDRKKIETEHSSKLKINNIFFEEASIKLPTLFMIEAIDGTQIEVSIQKQQYASGVQPMVYFCIPLKSFNNHKDIMGRPSISGDSLVYVINKENVSILFDMLKIFAMCSKRHNHDIIEIIKILIKLSHKN
jgi:hypothetical protein